MFGSHHIVPESKMACVGVRLCGEGVLLGPVSAPQDATVISPWLLCSQEMLTRVRGLTLTGRTLAAPKQEPDPQIRVLVKDTLPQERLLASLH